MLSPLIYFCNSPSFKLCVEKVKPGNSLHDQIVLVTHNFKLNFSIYFFKIDLTVKDKRQREP